MKTWLALTIAGLLLGSGSAMAEDPSGCLKVDKIMAPRRIPKAGGELEIEIRVRLKTSHCVLANDYGAGTTATLALEHPPGLEATSGLITYSGLEGASPYLDAARAHAVETTVTITASNSLAKGQYRIPAALNYEAIDERGQTIHESLAFTIPVKFDGGRGSYWQEHPDLQKGLTIAGAAILMLVAAPVLILECWIGGNCWTC
jgi:hypothetical protein